MLAGLLRIETGWKGMTLIPMVMAFWFSAARCLALLISLLMFANESFYGTRILSTCEVIDSPWVL